MLLLLLFSHFALAGEAPDAVVWTNGSIRSAQSLFSPAANVVVMSAEDNARAERRAGYLPPDERDALYRKLGIETKISAMDELDKDMLMLGARAYSVRELKSSYPMLSEKQLRQLKVEMGKVK